MSSCVGEPTPAGRSTSWTEWAVAYDTDYEAVHKPSDPAALRAFAGKLDAWATRLTAVYLAIDAAQHKLFWWGKAAYAQNVAASKVKQNLQNDAKRFRAMADDARKAAEAAEEKLREMAKNQLMGLVLTILGFFMMGLGIPIISVIESVANVLQRVGLALANSSNIIAQLGRVSPYMTELARDFTA